MTKSFRELLGPLEVLSDDRREVAVNGLSSDSRTITPGDVFVAIEGTVADGHKYIPAALERGAAAVVFERAEASALIPADIPCARVAGSRRAAAVIADRFWDHPSGRLTLVAVTGTNGKTTTVHLLESIFRAAGHRCGMIGTLGRRVGDDTVEASRTTPDAIELQSLLARMLGEGISHVAMELSSHAIDLDRAYGCSFAGAVFTNLSQDHLDWHGDLETYRRAKARLFTDYVQWASPGRELVGAINIDDEAGRQIAAEARCRVVGYGLDPRAQVRAEGLQRSARGSRFDLVTPEGRTTVSLELVGPYNVANALAAASCAFGLGFALEEIGAGLAGLSAVPGRLEKVDRGQPFAVLVDYAHTPDALRNVLAAARELRPRRLLCVFGCGGDRDRTKRPLMGAAATELADLSIITSDNPRSEDPLAIIGDIVRGVAGETYQVEPDRAAAIRLALQQAVEGDIVLICGKGHEDYMEFENGRHVHFDDREVAAAVLDEAGA